MIECIVDTATVRYPVLRVRVRLHVRARATAGSATTTSSCRAFRTPTARPGIAFMAFWLFQFAFADTASTIVSGAMVGRTGFKGDLLYSIGVSGFIYPIFGHWVWGPNGWLATMNTPFRDFAGSTVVHTVGGVLALTGAIALGPRLGRKFKRDGGGMPPGPQHDARRAGRCHPLVRLVRVQPRQHALGDGLRGHRPDGDQHHARGLCRCAGRGRSGSTSGRRSGTSASASTGCWPVSSPSPCPCYWVSPTGSIAIGAVAGVDHGPRGRLHGVAPGRRPVRCLRRPRCVRHLGHAQPRVVRRRQLRPARCVGLGHHGAVKGLFYGGNANQLIAQIKGSATITCVHAGRRSAC